VRQDSQDRANKPDISLMAFMADLHHEIRSPVNTILNMTELAGREELPPNVRGYISSIEKSASALLTILDDIIELSQEDLESSEGNQRFSLTDLLEDVKEATEGPRLTKGVGMELDFSGEPPEWYSGPRGRMRQILTQLMNYSMRQLGAGSMTMKIVYGTDEYGQVLDFSLEAHDCTEELSPEDVLKNPRIMICRRLLVELGRDLQLKPEGGAFSFSFSMGVEPLELPWAEPLLPTPVACVVGRQGFAASLVARRMSGCGFRAVHAARVPEGQRLLEDETSQGQKAVMLVDWHHLEETGSAASFPDIEGAAGLGHPVIFFDVPAIKMMDLSSRLSDGPDTEGTAAPTGLVMSPTRGRQLIPEVLRLLKMEPQQLSCPMIDLEDEEEGLDPEALEGMKVLVVEDDRINQRIVVEILKRFRVKPVVASSGKAALLAVEKFDFDAIFMDINLPDTDGYRLTGQIRSRPGYADVPVIALTASTKNRKMCLEAGMDDFLSKPYSEAKLLGSLMRTRRRK